MNLFPLGTGRLSLLFCVGYQLKNASAEIGSCTSMAFPTMHSEHPTAQRTRKDNLCSNWFLFFDRHHSLQPSPLEAHRSWSLLPRFPRWLPCMRCYTFYGISGFGAVHLMVRLQCWSILPSNSASTVLTLNISSHSPPEKDNKAVCFSLVAACA